MSIFGANIIRGIFLPNNSQGGTVNAYANIIRSTANGHIAN